MYILHVVENTHGIVELAIYHAVGTKTDSHTVNAVINEDIYCGVYGILQYQHLGNGKEVIQCQVNNMGGFRMQHIFVSQFQLV